MELRIKHYNGLGWQCSWVVNTRVLKTFTFDKSILLAYNEAVVWAMKEGPPALCHAVIQFTPQGESNEPK
jgi:hypothetical protein